MLDSGGPLVCEENEMAVLRGLVSYGPCKTNGYAIYTDVTEYAPYIRETLVRCTHSLGEL